MKAYHVIINILLAASLLATGFHLIDEKQFFPAFPIWVLLIPTFYYVGMIILCVSLQTFKREIVLLYAYFFFSKKDYEEAKRWYRIGKKYDDLADRIDNYNNALSKESKK